LLFLNYVYLLHFILASVVIPAPGHGFWAGHGNPIFTAGHGVAAGHGAIVFVTGQGSIVLTAGRAAAVSAFGHGSTCLANGHPNGHGLYAVPELLQPDKNMHVTASINEIKINFLTFIIIAPFILTLSFFNYV